MSFLDLSELGPYLAVFSIGALIGIGEIFLTFKNYEIQAILTPWALILVLGNAIASLIVFFVVKLSSPETNVWILSIVVGLGFPSILRSPIVLAKPLGDNIQEDVRLDLSKKYVKFQKYCEDKIDQKLLSFRDKDRDELCHTFTLQELIQKIHESIDLRDSFSAEKKNSIIKEIDEIICSKKSENVKKKKIAYKLITYIGRGHKKYLTNKEKGSKNNSTDENLDYSSLFNSITELSKQKNVPEDKIKIIANQLPLQELIKYANPRLRKEFKETVDSVTQNADFDEKQRKAIIIYMLIQTQQEQEENSVIN